MTVKAPVNWFRGLEYETGNHPFKRIAWKIDDYADRLDGESAEIVQMIVDELVQIESTEFMRNHIKRTVRKVKIAKGEPVVVDDTKLKTAFHAAMLNMQLDTDPMSYDKFKIIYDEVCRQLEPKETDIDGEF